MFKKVEKENIINKVLVLAEDLYDLCANIMMFVLLDTAISQLGLIYENYK